MFPPAPRNTSGRPPRMLRHGLDLGSQTEKLPQVSFKQMTQQNSPRDARDERAPAIRIRGAEQNNLKHLNLDIPVGSFTVVTGLSGSGKSSLVFDTLYAEGQRRYVETFSPYARQFLDRMDRPKVESIEGVPPAIAIDQNAVIRTSRSTVGTMTEINDRLKLLFARKARAFCPNDGSAVLDFSPDSMWEDILGRLAARGESDARTAVAFEHFVPKALPLETAEAGLSAQGFTRILAGEKRRHAARRCRRPLPRVDRGAKPRD